MCGLNVGEITATPEGMRMLVHSGERRSRFAREVPTYREYGLNVEMASERGIVAPAGVPPAILQRLREETAAIAADPGLCARWRHCIPRCASCRATPGRRRSAPARRGMSAVAPHALARTGLTPRRQEKEGQAVTPGRAVIIGGSMGGLCAGLLLRRAGWRGGHLRTRGGRIGGPGAGIVTHPELEAALAACGVGETARLGVPVASRRLFDREGRVIAELQRPQITTSWDRLFRLLRRAFPDACYHSGKALVGLAEAAEGIRARFADGSTAEGDLLIAADGFRSTVRGLLLPEVEPVYAGYVGWRGLVPEADMPPDVHAALFAHFAFYLPPGEQILGYPAAGRMRIFRRGGGATRISFGIARPRRRRATAVADRRLRPPPCP